MIMRQDAALRAGQVGMARAPGRFVTGGATMMEPPALPVYDVAVIGGGASGTLLAAQLLRTARATLRVLLIERRPRPGQGVAYSTRRPTTCST